MYEANDFGGGAAWRDVDENGKPIVKWRKGLLVEDMQELAQTLPLPHVLHFRIPSHDTSKSLLACHPFVVNDGATTDWEGATPGEVLFHNGYWTDWRNKLQTISMQGFVRLPSGPWSDSRGLAWAANHLGAGFLEMVNEKVVTLGPGEDDLEVFGRWDVIKNPDAEGKLKDILVSNTGWDRVIVKVNDHRRPDIAKLMAPVNVPLVRQPGGAVDQDTFRSEARAAQGRAYERTQQESIQEEIEGAAQGKSALIIDGSGLHCSGEGCFKRTRAGQILDNKFYCWHCWSKYALPVQKKELTGTCQTCRVQYGAAKTLYPDQWICSQCWLTSGRPKIAFVVGSKEQYD